MCWAVVLPSTDVLNHDLRIHCQLPLSFCYEHFGLSLNLKVLVIIPNNVITKSEAKQSSMQETPFERWRKAESGEEFQPWRLVNFLLDVKIQLHLGKINSNVATNYHT